MMTLVLLSSLLTYGRGIDNLTPEARTAAKENVDGLKRWFMLHGNAMVRERLGDRAPELINVTREGDHMRFHFSREIPMSTALWDMYANPVTVTPFVTRDGRPMRVYSIVHAS